MYTLSRSKLYLRLSNLDDNMRAKLKNRIAIVAGILLCVFVIQVVFEPHPFGTHWKTGDHEDKYIKRHLAARDRETESDSRDTASEITDMDLNLDFHLNPDTIPDLTSLVTEMNKRRRPSKTTSGERLDIFPYGAGTEYKTEADLPTWKQFQNHITRYGMYNENDPVLDMYLEDLATLPLEEFDTIPDKGTQFKLVFELSDGGRAMGKPKRRPIDEEAPRDQYTFDEFERFQAEIAGFHLDKVLQFYRVPPVAGRLVNITADVKLKAHRDLRKTFYLSRVGNWCFYGVCDQLCLKHFPHCATGHMLAWSFAAYLPSRVKVPRIGNSNPWAQLYRRGGYPVWWDNATYCEDTRKQPKYKTGRRLLDHMDVAAFDFLQGNLDRHSFHTFKRFGEDANIILYDNGRAFGRTRHDIFNLLAPIFQCCLFRLSTLEKLLKFETGDISLGEALRQSLNKDKVKPVLPDAQFEAIDRRAKKILDTIHKCVLTKKGAVVIDDGF